jgi:hypothetical protein
MTFDPKVVSFANDQYLYEQLKKLGLVEDVKSLLDSKYILKNHQFSCEYLAQYHNYVNWKYACKYQDLTKELCFEYRSLVCWRKIFAYQKFITEEYVSEYDANIRPSGGSLVKYYIDEIIHNPMMRNLSHAFIEKYMHANNSCLFRNYLNQQSSSFIDERVDKIGYSELIKCKNFTEELFLKYLTGIMEIYHRELYIDTDLFMKFSAETLDKYVVPIIRNRLSPVIYIRDTKSEWFLEKYIHNIVFTGRCWLSRDYIRKYIKYPQIPQISDSNKMMFIDTYYYRGLEYDINLEKFTDIKLARLNTYYMTHRSAYRDVVIC